MKEAKIKYYDKLSGFNITQKCVKDRIKAYPVATSTVCVYMTYDVYLQLKQEAEEIKKRYEYWDVSRGGYILSQKYRTELEKFLFTAKAKGLGSWKQIKKECEE